MQELNDCALVLKVDAYGEYDALVSLFGQRCGLLRGIVKRGLSSKLRGIYCLGNAVEAVWTARLEEHLGTLSAELTVASGAMILAHRQRCYALQAACALVLLSFDARDPHPRLYAALQGLIDALQFDTGWQADYARFEALLLQEAGFGLGLQRCIVTGQAHDLAYLSPKSGCAVSRSEGAAFHTKLFAYPALLREEMHSPAHPKAVLQALSVTGHFLEKWLFAALEKPLPQSRGRLLQALEKDCRTPA